MASAGDDGAIIVWNVAAGKQLYQLTYEPPASPCRQMLACSLTDAGAGLGGTRGRSPACSHWTDTRWSLARRTRPFEYRPSRAFSLFGAHAHSAPSLMIKGLESRHGHMRSRHQQRAFGEHKGTTFSLLVCGCSCTLAKMLTTPRLDCPLLLQCLAKLDSEEGPPMFCSGGNDNKLCIWKSGTQQTQLLGCIERQEDESTALPHGSPT
jgi:hypothetical protein